ncbi:MAG TPA: glycosyltransferase [Anaerolineales bacterium]|nr:glycosyltransferase [Anaerolineales bacterium]
MKISVLAAGSRGDVQPYLALALGLKGAGFDVTFVANEDYAGMAAPFGLDFHPIGVNAYEYSKSPQVQAWLASKSTLDLVRTTAPAVRPVLEPIFRDTLAACRESDLVVYHSFTLPFIFYFAEHLGIPSVPASLYPLPTRAHASLPAQVRPGPGGIVNLLSHLAVEVFSWGVFAAPFRKFWAAHGRARGNPHRRMRRERPLVLCAYSPTVLPRPDDYPAGAAVTGYWFLEPDPAWTPDPDLEAFIAAGEPPVYVGFGSMGSPAEAEEMTAIVLEALAATGRRAVLGSGWGDLGGGQALPETVRMVRDVPFEWLFPRMAALVHHGGAGTTALGLRSGVPNVVVPHFSDNYFWARRVWELGAGPEPMTREALTAGRLAQALQASEEEAVRNRAQQIGRIISTEDGVQTAVKGIKNMQKSGAQAGETGWRT